jgi:alpha-mannosidase
LTDNSIENGSIKVTFDENFDIESILDKENNKELVKDGQKANSFIVFEDFPGGCDAWEIQSYYKEKAWRVGEFISAEKIVQGARAGFIVKKKYLDSIITQTITVYNTQKRVDFDTVIDWKEPHSVLKVEFPVDINFNKSVADMQFGKVERSAVTNTSWDEARFETCMHKYVDVSDGGYGVSLINDCKYGYDVLDGVLRLTILKCATFPFPEGDLCEHKLTYSLFLHDGALSVDTDRLAYSINNPVRVEKGTGKTTTALKEFSLVNVDSDSVIVETVKMAEDDNDIIVRLYESQNSDCTAKIEFGFDAISVCETDLMENNIKAIELVENSVSIKFKPFEIITLKVKRN